MISSVMMTSSLSLTIPPDSPALGARVDIHLASSYPSLSRAYFQQQIQSGRLTINGKRIKKRYRLVGGEHILFPLEKDNPPLLIGEPLPLDILYQDEELIVLNKPSGMVIHPGPGQSRGTCVHALLHHFPEISEIGEEGRPGIVHRLDKETSGLLLVARTQRAYHALKEAFFSRTVEKEYLAVCWGCPKKQRVSLPIGRHPRHFHKHAVLLGGKESISDIYPLASSRNYSLVLVRPLTGRTHQIRLHLHYLHTPIVGDSLYGRRDKYPPPHHLLHAHRLTFRHPLHRKTMHFQTPPPVTMGHIIDQQFGSLDFISMDE
ncbi:MAG: RluA family pseudouridine synthase [Chlamydiota bacterium]|nr:RluA family pseudouridine synthase [Chlamydiota bacterium]